MKYIKTFELNLNTYANYMDNTESFPWVSHMGNNEKGEKMGRINGLAKKRFEEEFYKLYPKKETKIYFSDRESTYELSFFAMKYNSNYTSYDLIFKTESGANVWIKNPFYIENIDLEKISLLPVEIKPESKDLINKMFNYGLSGKK